MGRGCSGSIGVISMTGSQFAVLQALLLIEAALLGRLKFA